MIVYNLDVWDTVEVDATGSYTVKQHLSLPNEPDFDKISAFEFDSRVFAGEIIDPFTGSIVEPLRTVQFFPVVQTMHVAYKHNSNDLTSVKKSIRAIMPSNFITEPHWAVLHGIFFAIDDEGNANEEEVWISTIVTTSVDITYQGIVDICSMVAGYAEADTWLELLDVTYVIRRPI